jgi:hypothetical protein
MRSKLNRFQARLVCAVVLGLGSSFSLAAAAEDSGDTACTKASETHRVSQLSAKAAADYQGDGLAVIPTPMARDYVACSNGWKARPRAKACG